MTELSRKLEILKELIKNCESVLVAFSGGVDSTLLLKIAHDVLGDKALAVTARSEIYPPGESEEAGALAGTIGIQHIMLKTRGLQSAAFAGNPPDRCYHCKKELYTELLNIARENKINCVLDGSNADDPTDYRPGMKAVKELGIHSPLMEAGLTKDDIYALSRKMGLPTAGKPASPCLASRFPYGTEITSRALEMVHKAEIYLKGLGIPQLRVRHHGSLARIEVPGEYLQVVVNSAQEVASKLKGLGYTYIALDLPGYRTGSMNETLAKE